MSEELEHAGGEWGPEKAYVFTRLVHDAGRTGSKMSLARAAKKAGVSKEFARSLKGYDARYSRGAVSYTRRERTKVIALLAAYGMTEQQFIAEVNGRLL